MFEPVWGKGDSGWLRPAVAKVGNRGLPGSWTGAVCLIEWNDTAFHVTRSEGRSPVVVVCEHASAFIPAVFQGLGLSPELREAHIAWDPGALDVARTMSERLDAPLVSGAISRLVYDCNRPPEAADAVPERSEVHDIPGNAGLSQTALDARAAKVYHPFHSALNQILDARPTMAILVTVHSFTPVYRGVRRDVELGILHDSDSRLADAMLDGFAGRGDLVVERNKPYGPEDGVTHTLRRHALPRGLLNVMIEIRNDLLTDAKACTDFGEMLAERLTAAVATCRQAEGAA